MLAIAHRGASGYAPENTRAAFDLALTMGAGAIETDVQLSADGEAVIFHDGTVDRTSDGRGPLGDYTLAELRALDIGGWYRVEFAGQRILTLAELLDEYAGQIPLAIEIKDPRAAAAAIAALTAREFRGGVQITSFHWPALLDAQAIEPKLPYGFLTPAFEEDTIARVARRGFAQICPHVELLSPIASASMSAPGASPGAIRSSASSRPVPTARPATGPTGSPPRRRAPASAHAPRSAEAVQARTAAA